MPASTAVCNHWIRGGGADNLSCEVNSDCPDPSYYVTSERNLWEDLATEVVRIEIKEFTLNYLLLRSIIYVNVKNKLC